MDKIKLNKYCKIKRITPKDGHYFFGYYNICPWNKKEDKVLACKSNFINRHPHKDDSLTIGYIQNNKFIKIDKTKTWNWQQGCMLQWLPNSEEVIYNKMINKKFVSIIYNIKRKRKEVVPFPIYSIHPSGKYALSLDFSRLNDTRKGYGYEGVEDIFKNKKIPGKGGIYLINLKTKKTKLIISIEQLSKLSPLDSMKYGKHWVNHTSFNPSGTRFCFFHRWSIPGGLFDTRIITSDINGKNIRVVGNGGHFSHIEWMDDENLFGWGATSKIITNIKASTKKSNFIIKKILPVYRILTTKKMRNKIFPQSYIIINDKTKKISKISLYPEDGHSTFSPNKKYVITDTYPTKKHYRKLILYNWKNKHKTILAEVFSLPNQKYSKDKNWDNSAMRCDLHPRWDRDSKRVCIDSVHDGERGMYEFSLE